MGTVRNEMTIVHHYDKNELEKVRKDAVKVFSQIIRQDAGVEEVEEYIEKYDKPYNEHLYKSRIYFRYKWRWFKNWVGNV